MGIAYSKGATNGAQCGIVMPKAQRPSSRATPAVSEIITTRPPRAMTSSTFDKVFPNSPSGGATTTTGTLSSMRATSNRTCGFPCIRLSDKTSRLRPRHIAPKPGQTHEPAGLVGAVLHLAGGVAFGVDVGDLLQLQGAFERQRIGGAAAEIEDVAGER